MNALYWDVNTRIELLLRVRGQERAKPGLAATGTDGPVALARPDFHFHGQSPRFFAPTYRAVHKTTMQLHPIQDRLDLHPVFSFLAQVFLVEIHNAKKEDGMLCFQTPSGGTSASHLTQWP